MPTYQYACTVCDHGFEVVQAFTDEALTECPQCQGRLRKVFGSVGVVFKGSGFYRTDSREKPKTGESADKGKSDGKADGAKADGKPKSDAAASSTSSASGSGGSSSNGSSPNGSSSTSKTASTAGSAA